MPRFPLLEGPQQSARTAVALAAVAPAAEVMTDTRVFPDTAAPDASVERATDTRVFPDTATPDASVERAVIKLTSAAGPSSKICGENRAFRYYNSSCPKHGSNSNSSNSSKSSGNDGSSSSSNNTGPAVVACRGGNSSNNTGLAAVACRGNRSNSSNGLAAVVSLININVAPILFLPPGRRDSSSHGESL